MKKKQLAIFLIGILLILLLIGNGDHGSLQQASPAFHNSGEPTSLVPLGMTIFPRGELRVWTDQGFNEAYQLALEGGVTVAILRHQWGDVEKRPGIYDWGSIDYTISKTLDQGLRPSLVIEVIHTNAVGRLPFEVEFKGFDDPQTKAQFNKFIRELLTRYKGKIDYLWIGNEVDYYLHLNPEEVKPFMEFYDEIEVEAKSIDPDITMGIVGAYHLARKNNEIELLRELGGHGDAIALTVYMEDDDSQPDVSMTESYFEEMFTKFPGKIAIIETSWSTRGPRGGELLQEKYIKSLSRVIEKNKYRLIFFSWFTLYDLSDETNRLMLDSFGIDSTSEWGEEFAEWTGSLGLFYSNGTAKPGWTDWKNLS